MKVEMVYVHTDDNEAQVVARFSVPSLEGVPMRGDLASFSDSDGAQVYTVISRWFTWKSETDLQIQLLLARAQPSLRRMEAVRTEAGNVRSFAQQRQRTARCGGAMADTTGTGPRPPPPIR